MYRLAWRKLNFQFHDEHEGIYLRNIGEAMATNVARY